ncbi:MAG: hypothetical protein ACYTFT_06830, partial [Planctomycetota bacterium]
MSGDGDPGDPADPEGSARAGILWMLAAALGFSTMAVMVKFASRGGDVSPFTVVLGRSVVVLTL